MVEGMSKYYGLVSGATVATQGQGMKLCVHKETEQEVIG
jgi:hypothetical protein